MWERVLHEGYKREVCDWKKLPSNRNRTGGHLISEEDTEHSTITTTVKRSTNWAMLGPCHSYRKLRIYTRFNTITIYSTPSFVFMSLLPLSCIVEKQIAIPKPSECPPSSIVGLYYTHKFYDQASSVFQFFHLASINILFFRRSVMLCSGISNCHAW